MLVKTLIAILKELPQDNEVYLEDWQEGYRPPAILTTVRYEEDRVVLDVVESHS